LSDKIFSDERFQIQQVELVEARPVVTAVHDLSEMSKRSDDKGMVCMRPKKLSAM
jgi:hypothetical protein